MKKKIIDIVSRIYQHLASDVLGTSLITTVMISTVAGTIAIAMAMGCWGSDDATMKLDRVITNLGYDYHIASRTDDVDRASAVVVHNTSGRIYTVNCTETNWVYDPGCRTDEK
jgi:hypothetical protein